jgi:hypothetical protein
MIAIIDKTDLRKINPEKLFFIHHSQIPSLFIHNVAGEPVLCGGFEGAAFMNEENTEKILKKNKHLEAISVSQMSRLLPVYLNFPEGHKLSNDLVKIQTANGPTDLRDLQNMKKL